MIVVRMGVFGFEIPDPPGEGHAGQQGDVKRDATVGMEFHFRQQIAESDAQEDTGGEGQGEADQQRLIARELLHSHYKKQRPQGTEEGKGGAHGMAGDAGPAAGGHHRGDRNRIERFVQDDGQKGPQSQQSRRAVQGVGFDADAEASPSIRVCKAIPRKTPTQLRLRLPLDSPLLWLVVMIVIMLGAVVMIVAGGRRMLVLPAGIVVPAEDLGRAVMMKMEEAQQEEHDQQPGHHAIRRQIRAVISHFHQRVREHVEDADAEHEASREADQNLHAGVRQVHQLRQPAPQERCADDRHTIQGQAESAASGRSSRRPPRRQDSRGPSPYHLLPLTTRARGRALRERLRANVRAWVSSEAQDHRQLTAIRPSTRAAARLVFKNVTSEAFPYRQTARRAPPCLFAIVVQERSL